VYFLLVLDALHLRNCFVNERDSMANLDKTHLAVIGGGPGGYAAAFHAADLGLDVTLIDIEANPGGTCLYRGCIPSKALLHVAKLINDARDAEEWGLKFAPPEMDLDKMRARTQLVVEQMTGGLGQLCQARNIRYERARASFIDCNTLALHYADGSKKRLSAEYVIFQLRDQVCGEGVPLPGQDVLLIKAAAFEGADKLAFVRGLEKMEPFGQNNAEPLFCAFGVELVTDSVQVLKEQHLKFFVHQNDTTHSVLGFYKAERFCSTSIPRRMDLVFSPHFNTYNGNTTIQLLLQDLRSA
jgi:hypothetical protein